MDRRTFLTTATGAAGVSLTGCLGGDPAADRTETATDSTDSTSQPTQTRTTSTSSNALEGTLAVATYSSFVDAPSSSPGSWIKQEFERRHPGVTLEWKTPENPLNHYIQRRAAGADLGADVYVGMKVPELVRVDEKLSKPLFEPVETGRLSNFDSVRSGYQLDPSNRVLPLFTGYCSFVYNGYEVDAPESLDALTTPAYRGKVTVQSPITDNTGLYFLLWTVKVNGEDGYLDYWRKLVDNDARILGTWGETYAAFSSGDTPLITSYSTDQVYAMRSGDDLQKHQVAFPGGHGYTNLSGIGKFATSEQDELVSAFVDFMLGPDAQGKLAELNVSFPVTDHASVPAVFEEYAKEPPEPLLFTYDELVGKIGTWRDDWSRLVAEK